MARSHVFNEIVVIYLGLVLTFIYVVRFFSLLNKIDVRTPDLMFFTITVLVQMAWSITSMSVASIYIDSKGSDLILVAILYCSLSQYAMFYQGILMIIHDASLIRSTDIESGRDGLSGNPGQSQVHNKKGHRKTVSFNEKTTKYLYSDDNISVRPSSLSVSGSSGRSFSYVVLQNIGIVAAIFGLSIFMIPLQLLLASTTKIYELEGSILIKTDHFIFAPLAYLLGKLCGQFLGAFNHPLDSSFPKGTAIATMFTWMYSCFVLCMSIYFLGLSKDVLHGLLENFNRNEYSQSPVSALVVDFVRHAAQKCEGEGPDTCKVDQAWVGQVVASSMAVFSCFCYLIVPLLVWVLVVEMKIARLLRNTN